MTKKNINQKQIMVQRVSLRLVIDNVAHEMSAPRDFLAGHLQIMCRARRLLDSKTACFLLHEKSGLLFSNASVGEFYDRHSENGVLELCVKSENTFG